MCNSEMLRHLVIIVSFFALPAYAQENLDSLYTEARQAAMEEKTRDQAILMCERALDQNPEYHDFRILLGRCYSWSGNYAQAEMELLQVVKAEENYQDARNALLDTYIWSKQDEKALELLASSIQKYPEELNYKMKQVRIFFNQGKLAQALDSVDLILELDPANEEALALKDRLNPVESPVLISEELDTEKPKRSTTIRYAHNRLAETSTEWQFFVLEPSLDPWHWVSLEHKEPLSIGPIIFKLNYANRFQNTATQIEIESYPTLRKGTYLYTGVGFSKSDLFPSFRAGFEGFQSLPKDFEASLGFRYLEVPDKQIFIYTGSLGKYWKSYWFSFKTYLSPSNSSLSKSWIMAVRKYLASPPNYIELYAGSGVSPDVDLGGEEIGFLGSRNFGFNYKVNVAPHWDMDIGAHFSNLETRAKAFRGDTGLQLSLTRNY